MANPNEWLTDTLWLMTSVLLVINVINAIFGIVDRSKRPEQRQNDEIAGIKLEVSEIKRKLEKFDEYFDNDDNRIKTLEAGNRVTQQMLLALARHSIDGNHIDELQKASDKLNYYLVHGKEERSNE